MAIVMKLSGLCGLLLFPVALLQCQSASVLHQAARAGDATVLARELEAGVDPDRREHGRTALLEASLAGQPESIRILLEAGADPTLSGPAFDDGGPIATPLFAAVSRGDRAAVESLLAQPDSAAAALEAPGWNGMTPLMEAARVGRGEIAALLLRRGAMPDRTDGLGRTALSWAALTGRAELVRTLLDAGASPDLPDLDGQTPYDLARARNHADTARLLAARR